MRLILFVLFVCITVGVSESISAPPAANRSPELQLLDRLFIGEWETVVTVKATGEKSTSTQSRKWSREGNFVLSEEQDLATKKESHFLITYDAKAGQYRACFINEEVTAPLVGTWDEKSQTMTWQSTDVAFKQAGVSHFIDKDHVEWTMTVTNPEGKVVLELSAKQTRRKS